MYVHLLMEKVRADPYPSWTQMNMIEDAIPPAMIPDYLEVLFEKVQQDSVPSISMLRRIAEVAEQLPIQEQRGSRRSR